jgi:hypothetical protein
MANGVNGLRLTVIVGVLGIVVGIGGKGVADRLSMERGATSAAVEISTIKTQIGELKHADEVLSESAVSVREFSQFTGATDKRLEEILDQVKSLRAEFMQANRRGK